MMKKNAKQVKTSKKNNSRRRAEAVRNRKSPTSSQDEDDDSEDDNLPSSYHQISIQVNLILKKRKVKEGKAVGKFF